MTYVSIGVAIVIGLFPPQVRYFDEGEHLHLVYELCEGPDLFEETRRKILNKTLSFNPLARYCDKQTKLLVF